MFSTYAETYSSVVVTWVTFDPTEATQVQYNLHGYPLALTASGGVTKFVDGGLERSVRYIHRVTLTGLLPAQKYGESPVHL